jgi:hypothetical protein
LRLLAAALRGYGPIDWKNVIEFLNFTSLINIINDVDDFPHRTPTAVTRHGAIITVY